MSSKRLISLEYGQNILAYILVAPTGFGEPQCFVKALDVNTKIFSNQSMSDMLII